MKVMISILALLFPLFVMAQEAKTNLEAKGKKIVVYKSPTCGCCVKWESHLKQAGFEVESVSTNELQKKKVELGVPSNLWSCHTAVVDGLVIEGHVPASSIQKYLKKKARGKGKGLAVAGMPIGSPGMEGPNPEKYDVIQFDGDKAQKVFEKF